jgi:hypothetical protein
MYWRAHAFQTNKTNKDSLQTEEESATAEETLLIEVEVVVSQILFIEKRSLPLPLS